MEISDLSGDERASFLGSFGDGPGIIDGARIKDKEAHDLYFSLSAEYLSNRFGHGAILHISPARRQGNKKLA